MSDLCYRCDGTGERDFLSGATCPDCNGTGWCDDADPLEEISLEELREYEQQTDEEMAS